MAGNDKLKTRKCLECGKRVIVVRGKSGDDGNPLDSITAFFACENCGLEAVQYYRIELSADRQTLLLPHGVELSLECIDREVDATRTWIGKFPSTNEMKVYIVEGEDHERRPTRRDLQKP